MADCTSQGAACDIKIDKDGVWFYNGAEMFRKDILDIFFKNIHRDGTGNYYVQLGEEICYLSVEDTPVVVKSVHSLKEEDGGSEILMLLSDSRVEKVDLESLRINAENVLYCDIGKGFPARFTRAAYYQICEHIECDGQDRYYIEAGGKKYYIREMATEENNAGR